MQPGVVLDQLNAFLRPHGLWFPVDVSTSAQATIGGMAGNNSCGSRSIRYGNMVHNVLGVRCVAVGRRGISSVRAMPMRKVSAAYRALVERVHAIVRREAAEIEARWPKVLRRVQGYNLDMVAAAPRRTTSRICWSGSEGTLAFSRRVQLKLAPIPAHKVLGVVHFPTFHQAMDMTRAHRQARSGRGRAGRPHDDRTRARQRRVPADRRSIPARASRTRSCWWSSPAMIATRSSPNCSGSSS